MQQAFGMFRCHRLFHSQGTLLKRCTLSVAIHKFSSPFLVTVRWRTGSAHAEQGFQSLGLSDASLRALCHEFRYDKMTAAQSIVLPALLQHFHCHLQVGQSRHTGDGSCKDVIVHARAGTGKTLAYLIPAIEQLVREPALGVGVVVVAPTRELALQVAREAERLCAYHPFQVVPLVGGVRRDRDEAMIRRRRPAILVCTPRRLVEHFECTAHFQTLFEGLRFLVLDECDRLLEEDVDALRELLSYVPARKTCRRLLLSATVPEEVRELAARVCASGYALLDCVSDPAGGTGAATQENLEQLYVICPGLLAITVLRNALLEEISERPTSHKMIVFFPTARVAAFVSLLFRQQLKMRILELHGRCDPTSRMVTQDRFQSCTSGILFTSGASERGMDYANVSLVVQFCAPESREQYIHRVGRTARGGKSGCSLMILLKREAATGFLEHLDDIPVELHQGQARLLHDEGDSIAHVLSASDWVENRQVSISMAAAFASLLRHYRERQHAVPLSAGEAVEVAAELMVSCGAAELPPISQRLITELELEGCGLQVASQDERGGRVDPSPEVRRFSSGTRSRGHIGVRVASARGRGMSTCLS